MPTFIVVSSLTLAFITIILGIGVNPNWYFISAFMMYIFSFMTGFTIGYYMLSITFSLFLLAIAHSFVKVKDNYFWNFLVSVASLLIGFAL